MNPTASYALPSFVDSETDLEFALDAHAIAIFEWNAKTGAIEWAPGSAERLGMNPPSTYDEWSKNIDPSDLQQTMDSLEKAAQANAERFRYCFRMLDRDGEQRVIEGASRFVYDDNGDLERTISVSIDVTNRFEVRRALSASHEQFQSVLETSPTALIITDEDGIVLTYSRSAEELFGYKASQVVGRHFNRLTSERIKALLIATKHQRGQAHQLTALKENGETAPVEVTAHQFGGHGPTLHTIFIRDMTERYESEQRLETLREELAHAARLNTMGEVSAGIAHELNQPLTAMTNYLAAARNMLKSGEAEPENLERLIDLASKQALRSGDIIRKMRDFLSRGETEFQPHSIVSLIKEAVSLTSLGGRKPHFDLQINLDHPLPDVLVDKIQIQQVLVNLIKNAVEQLRLHPVTSPKITVSATFTDPSHISIAVADNGPGISPDIQQNLFVPFSTSKDTGMGLGLSISRRILEAHGSMLVGENDPTGGAIFRFNLPTHLNRKAA